MDDIDKHFDSITREEILITGIKGRLYIIRDELEMIYKEINQLDEIQYKKRTKGKK